MFLPGVIWAEKRCNPGPANQRLLRNIKWRICNELCEAQR